MNPEEADLTPETPPTPDTTASDAAALAAFLGAANTTSETLEESIPSALTEETPTLDSPVESETPTAPEAPEPAKAKVAATKSGKAPKAPKLPPQEIPIADPDAPILAANKKWYIVKITSGREESIKAAIERKIKIEGLEQYFGQVHIPVERVQHVKKVKETKNGETTTKEKRVTKEIKKYPGYIMVEVEFNDQVLYLMRETAGVGDFVTGGPGRVPTPMEEIDVQRMLGDSVAADAATLKGRKGKVVVKLDFEKGDKVRARDGAFAGMEGEVKEISVPKDSSETPKVTVEVTIFGRPVQIELEHYQVDKV
ncbi:MAG: transcription termination/antitermination NusG family protein [Fimbriiglobus sp.]